MLPYATLPDTPDTPDTPTDVSLADQLEDLQDVPSPIDPSQCLLSRSDTFRTNARCTGGTEFFSAVYLDVKSDHQGGANVEDEGEEEEEDQWDEMDDVFVGTEPLRIQKRLARKATLKHRSIISGPVSPRSTISRIYPSRPSSPGLARSNTTASTSTTSTLHPHHSISRIFLNGSPTLASPPPPLPPKSAARLSSCLPLESKRPRITRETSKDANLTQGRYAKRQARQARTRPHPQTLRRASIATLAQSEYHLNLGQYGMDDGLLGLGPSPPVSPSPTYLQASPSPTHQSDRRPSRPLPPSPLTPSRAPAKAAKLLGTCEPTTNSKPRVFGVDVNSAMRKLQEREKKKEHYRPIPTQTLVEIERFFGEVPRDPKPTRKPRLDIVHLGLTGRGAHVHASEPRHIGEGREVRWKDALGNTWRDAAEEQEFAWLMSDLSLPSPSSSGRPRTVSSPSMPRHPTSERKPEPTHLSGRDDANQHRTAEGKIADASGTLGKEALRSVVVMPQPTIAQSKTAHSTHTRQPAALISASTAKSAKTAQDRNGKKNKKATRGKGESFMDFEALDSPVHQATAMTRGASQRDEKHVGWTSSTESLAVLTPTVSESSSSPPPSPRAELIPSRSPSPPRVKNRPPPLTLKQGRKNPNLPIISTTPTPRKIRSSVSGRESAISGNSPATPFVRPRRAPLPNVISIPTVPAVPSVGRAAHVGSDLPRYASIDLDSDTDGEVDFGAIVGPGSRYPRPGVLPTITKPRVVQSKAARLMGLDPLEDPTMHDVSFFEPDSPTEAKSSLARKYGLSTKAAAGAGGGRWFRNIVKSSGVKV